MTISLRRVALALLSLCAASQVSLAQSERPPIPGQLAQDFVAGRVPRASEVEAAEADAAAKPNDLAVVRRLGKAYFFQYFGGNNSAAIPKAQATLDRALAISKDDPETLAYSGALWVFLGGRRDAGDPAKQKEDFDKGFELLQRAERIAPRNGAVGAITAGSYVELPKSYGMAQHVVDMLEGMRRGMGPAWDQFSHHGRQRLLLTMGRAYAQVGKPAEARARFDEALKINEQSAEAGLLRTELSKLPTP
jgi:tetratricopeptide (TPR) repeat protein